MTGKKVRTIIYLSRPNRPGVRLSLPDHRRRDMDPLTPGRMVESAGLPV